MIRTGSDFSGVGAFDQALKRVKVKYITVFACDMDKHARKTYIENYGEPAYFPENVYDRDVPEEPLDIYMTSPPCQAFSMAGKRKGEKDRRGVLFYNSHEFIQKNKPRFFIFENVKGLLSDDDGKTFQRWLDFLGGKSVNGSPMLFPHEESVPYHIYWAVLNAKEHGVPQNRERVFIVGIRDDADNQFLWPKEEPLEKKLKDVLEEDVEERFFLSEESIDVLLQHDKRNKEKGNNFKTTLHDPEEDVMSVLKVGGKGRHDLIKIKSATSTGYETAEEGDSINLSQINSKTRRGRVGKGVAQTLDTSCNQAVMIAHVSRTEEGKKARKAAMAKGKDYTPFQAKKIEFKEADVMNCVTTATTKDNLIMVGAIRGRNTKDGEGRVQQQLELNDGNTSNAITTVQKDNVVIQISKYQGDKVTQHDSETHPCLSAQGGNKLRGVGIQQQDFRIRRLTPRECFRLMDFPDTFTWSVSDTQAYKQAGNSIVVNVLAKIIARLKEFNFGKGY